MRLSELPQGEAAVIEKVLGRGALRKRLIEMGFVRGRRVEALRRAPLRDPIEYRVMGYDISLRAAEAAMVIVEPVGHDTPVGPITRAPEAHTQAAQQQADRSATHTRTNEHATAGEITVALVGNPNCGKTSLFNMASGARERVGNYSGVTVDAKRGTFLYGGYRFNIIDLPGTYSLSSYSPEEKYVRNYLGRERPDVIINVVVASNLERNLYLTTELLDMDLPMVIALNMYDELEASGDKIDYKLLGSMIGVPITPTVTRTGRGVDRLLDSVIEVYQGKNTLARHIDVRLSPEIEESINMLTSDMLRSSQAYSVEGATSLRYQAVKLLEGDEEMERDVAAHPGGTELLHLRDREVRRLQRLLGENVSDAIADEKYGFIKGALAETFTKGDKDPESTTRVIDAVVTNKVIGFPIFLAIMFVMFWATFYLGSFPMEWLEAAVDVLGNAVGRWLPEGWLKDLIADGIIGGVGGVIVFLPNIMILYFCISFMEDSGYMARAAFIMDRLMHRIGLHGKSFIPLVMGFGCNVPAVMATRAIESPSSRLITILINPFMSCSARLPIYVLLAGTFFPNHAPVVFMGLYLLGILVAMLTAKLLRRFHFKQDETPFVMELPPYRIPTLKAAWRHTWSKGRQYLKKMGGVILVAAIVVWALNYFPLHSETSSVPSEQSDTPSLANDSYLEMMGKAVNPAMEPLGFHWRATVAALAGIPAKEIVVSTLGVLYTGDEDFDSDALSARIVAPSPITGQPDFNMASALAFMVFILLYCPCIATIMAVVREAGSWRYGAFAVLYNTAVAWVFAFITYRLALLFI